MVSAEMTTTALSTERLPTKTQFLPDFNPLQKTGWPTVKSSPWFSLRKFKSVLLMLATRGVGVKKPEFEVR